MATDASIDSAFPRNSSNTGSSARALATAGDAPMAGRALRGNRVGREGWTGTTDGRGLATFLGWFSVALGAAELLAPRGTLRAIGVRPSAGKAVVLRAMG